MARDFIFRMKPGESLPPVDPTGPRVLLGANGKLKLLNTDGSVTNLIEEGTNSTISEYTETIVTINPTETTYSDGRPSIASGILSMGASINLLPNAGIGNYYDIDKIVVISGVGNSYMPGTFDNEMIQIINQNSFMGYISFEILNGDNQFSIVTSGKQPQLVQANSTNYVTENYASLNGNVRMVFRSGLNPINGTRPLIVKIYHKTVAI